MKLISRPAVAMLAVLWCSPAFGQGPPPAHVLVEPAETQTLESRRRLTGQLHAVARSRVATAEDGLVVECKAEEGQEVRAGDVLAVIDARRLEIERLRLQASAAVADAIVTARTAERDRAARDLEILRSLAGRAAANMNELSDGERDLDIAAARLSEAERGLTVIDAEQSLLAIRLRDMRVVAPFDAVVVDVATEVGEWVSKGDPIAELVAIGRYEAWIDVPENMRAALAMPAARAEVAVEAIGLDASGLPVRVVPLVDPIARTFRAIIQLDDPEHLLADGMSAVAWLPTGRSGAHLTVPRDALLRNEIGAYVYAVREAPQGGIAAPMPVRVLFDAGDRVAVDAARLAPGTPVVVEGAESLYPGSVVIARPRVRAAATPAPTEIPGGEDG